MSLREADRECPSYPLIDGKRLIWPTRNCTGFCTDWLHPGLTGLYWPFRGTFPEVIEAKGRRFIIRSL